MAVYPDPGDKLARREILNRMSLCIRELHVIEGGVIERESECCKDVMIRIIF